MEISQNTLLKLIVRQGTNTERLSVTLGSGELGYSNDTERLFIGNGYTVGGKKVGTVFHGETTDITTISNPEINDLAFDLDKGKLYFFKGTDSTTLSCWTHIGTIYSSGDSYISISNNNLLTLNPISAYGVDSDLLNSPLYLSGGKISLSAIDPNLVSTNTITVSSGLIGYVGDTNVTNTAVNPLTGSLVISSSNTIARFDALSGLSTIFVKNVTTCNKISAGHYSFTYGPLSDSNIVVIPTILGVDGPGCYARTISISNSSCHVKILSGYGETYYNDVNLLINIVT